MGVYRGKKVRVNLDSYKRHQHAHSAPVHWPPFCSSMHSAPSHLSPLTSGVTSSGEVSLTPESAVMALDLMHLPQHSPQAAMDLWLAAYSCTGALFDPLE